MTRMKRFLYVACALLCLALCGCSGGTGGTGRKTKEEIQKERTADSLALKVGVMQRIDCLPAFVARDGGVFDSLGVDVRLYPYTSMLDYDKSMERARLDGVFSDAKHLEYLNATTKLALRTEKTFDMQWKLVANRKARVRKLGQFTDKMIAMSRCSVTDFLCDRVTDSARIDKDRLFRIQVNDLDLRLKMLLNNEIDAAWLPEPQASVAVRRGCNVLMESGARGERFAVLAFTGRSYTDSRRKRQIELFVKAYGIAAAKIDKGGGEYRKSLLKHYFKY